MEATRNMKLNTLKARIERADYQVDHDAVAEAIVRRLLAARGRGPAVGGGPGGPASVRAG